MGEKTMKVIWGMNVRHIINLANEKNIKKEDIVSLLKEGGQYILIYYGSGE
jgi:hypothetical protein